MGKIAVIIPSFNIAGEVGRTTKGILNTGIVDEVIVVDDGSKDETARVALENGARVIRNKETLGRSLAIASGISSVKNMEDISVVVLLNGKLGLGAREMKKVINPVADGEVEMCIAGCNYENRRRNEEALANFGVKLLTENNMKWPLSEDRAMSMERLKSIKKFTTGYGFELGLTIDWLRAGFTVEEIEMKLPRMNFSEKENSIKSYVRIFDITKAILPRALKRHPGRKKGK